ncbi:MAG: NADPH-dependent oxidoreductase [Calditrichaeota bacterium]|nr:MAG: NADPH-dependent oxidoreductase [Calditrichota bacterium]
MNYIIFSCSLNPNSKSYILAKTTYEVLKEQNHNVELIDLRNFELPFCNGTDIPKSHPNVRMLQGKIETADGILIAVPIYNFDINSALKNLVELTGRVWSEKTLGFLCSAGGFASYMSVMSFANSMMLDFRCLIIPRIVYATGSAFENGVVVDQTILERIDQLVRRFTNVTIALKD